MDNHILHNHYHEHARNYSTKVKMHRNSKNILSILFDEVNCSEERFKIIKNELYNGHKFPEIAHKESNNDVFSKLT